MNFYIGDVRDRADFYRALDGVDIWHCTRRQQKLFRQPNTILSNASRRMADGAMNLVRCMHGQDLKGVVALYTTDKASSPM